MYSPRVWSAQSFLPCTSTQSFILAVYSIQLFVVAMHIQLSTGKRVCPAAMRSRSSFTGWSTTGTEVPPPQHTMFISPPYPLHHYHKNLLTITNHKSQITNHKYNCNIIKYTTSAHLMKMLKWAIKENRPSAVIPQNPSRHRVDSVFEIQVSGISQPFVNIWLSNWVCSCLGFIVVYVRSRMPSYTL